MEFLDLGPAMLSGYLALTVFLLLWARDIRRLRAHVHWQDYLLGMFRDRLLRRRLTVAAAIVLVGGIAQIVVDVFSGKPLGFGLLLLTGTALLHVAAETRDFRAAAEHQPRKMEVT